MGNIISDTVKNLLGNIEFRLYNRQEADALILEAKQLEEAVNPTIEHLQAQGRKVQAKANITIAHLENAAVTAKATTEVAVATADAVEVIAEQSQIYAAAVERVRTVAANVTPAYAAMLSGKNANAASPQLPERQNSFLQLPHRR